MKDHLKSETCIRKEVKSIIFQREKYYDAASKIDSNFTAGRLPRV